MSSWNDESSLNESALWFCETKSTSARNTVVIGAGATSEREHARVIEPHKTGQTSSCRGQRPVAYETGRVLSVLWVHPPYIRRGTRVSFLRALELFVTSLHGQNARWRCSRDSPASVASLAVQRRPTQVCSAKAPPLRPPRLGARSPLRV